MVRSSPKKKQKKFGRHAAATLVVAIFAAGLACGFIAAIGVLAGRAAAPRPRSINVTPTPVFTVTPAPTEATTPVVVVVERVVTATPAPTNTPTSAPTPTLSVELMVTQVPLTGRGFTLGWSVDWYRSPFTRTTDSLPVTGTIETFAEPGVLLDATAAFDHMSAPDTPILCPEGGYAYIAIGGVTLSHNGSSLLLPYVERNIYLVFVRGLPDDGGASDLNQIVFASQYVRSTGIYSPMPAGAYISLGWTIQQIQNSFRGPNCGATGCQTATVVVVDIKTHSFRSWVINDPKNLRNWVPVG